VTDFPRDRRSASDESMPEGTPEGANDRRFEELLRGLVGAHAGAARFRATELEAERLLGDGLRIADAVRRAARRGEASRPDPADCAHLARIVERLNELTNATRTGASALALREAWLRGDLARTADLACELFAGLDREWSPPAHAYAALALRRRMRGRSGSGGSDAGEAAPAEALIHPERLADEIASRIEAGLAAEPGGRVGARPPSRGTASPAAEAEEDLPEPLVLAPSLAGCESEVAIRIRSDAIAAPILRHRASGELWIFTTRLGGPFEVAAAREADDEWWAASPLGYASYLTALAQALERKRIAIVMLGAEDGTRS